MKWLYLFLLFAGCMGTGIDTPAGADASNLILLNAPQFDQDISDGLNLAISAYDNSMTTRALSQRLALITSPRSNCFATDNGVERHPLVVKKEGSTFAVTTRRKLLVNQIYGLYVYDNSHQQYCLNYVFRTFMPPKLVSHDLGEGVIKLIPNNRRRMRLTFDQPVENDLGNAIAIVNVDNSKPNLPIEKLEVEADEKTLWIYLNENHHHHVPGSRYQLRFSASINAAAIDLQVVEHDAPPLVVEQPTIHVAATFVEISWPKAFEQRLEIFIRDTLGSDPPFFSERYGGALHASSTLGLTSLLVDGLRPSMHYDYVLRAEDAQGQVAAFKGSFTTSEPSDLSITELMVDPLIPGGGAQETGEYIEIANLSTAPRSLAGFSLHMQDLASGRHVQCSVNSVATLASGEHALLVARDFNTHLYNLDDKATVIRLAQKGLCQGLANRSAKIIRLFQHDGVLLDLYGGHLWPGKKGKAIARAPTTGLADKHNYCYSHPTPGKQNGPCG